MSTTGPHLIEVTGISKSFAGVPALQDVDVHVARGEVLCLAGENGCGKSTLVKLLTGVYVPDSGTITMSGEQFTGLTPRQAIAHGVQVIYQDLSLFDHMTVAENIAISALRESGRWFTTRRQAEDVAREQLENLGLDLPLRSPVSELSMANRQLVAICRALAMDAKVLFMDEPTTALTTNEVARLLETVEVLKSRGISIVFISHKLDEVFSIADRITVIRDGRKVGDFVASELDSASLSRHMTGRSVSYERYERRTDDDADVLRLEGLTSQGKYRDVSLRLRRGDVLGITGLLGSGRTELALSLFGLNAPDAGRIWLDGRYVTISDPHEARELGVALLPEDRQQQGLFGAQSVRANISAANMGKVVRRVLQRIDPAAEQRLADETVHRMRVNNRDTSIEVEKLSGGNQQKVVFGKWVATQPRVYVLDSPTVGIDIGSKAELYAVIRELAAEGMGVVLISDEPEEIVANCNRVLLMHEGEVLHEFSAHEIHHDDAVTVLAEAIANPHLYRTPHAS